MKNRSDQSDWIELDEGFYIVEESGSHAPKGEMSKQADETYQDIKEAFEGRIVFAEDPQ